jgi:glycosyltransferase involved in cell wall biosynthesis
MPVYNAETYLEKAVESILNQTFSDFEFFIIDDGSTDGSAAILERYADSDPRIRLISRPNRGLAPTLNELVNRSRGELIARMDADDISMPERLQRQVDYLHDHPDCVLVASHALVIDREDDPIAVWFKVDGHKAIDEHNMRGNMGTALCHPSIMMRRSAIQRVGGYCERYRIGEDLDLFLKLAEVGQLANIPETLIQYRHHESSFTKTRSHEEVRDLLLLHNEARRRRGLPEVEELQLRPFHLTPLEKHNEVLGWQALMSGNVATARKQARRSVAQAPLSMNAWRLLFCSMRGH